MTSKKIAQHPSITHAVDLQAICEPLKELGISYFSHVRLDEENRVSGLALEPKFVQLYLEKRYYNFDVYLQDVCVPEQYVLWDTFERAKETKELYDDFKSFGLGHSFSIIQSSNGYKDCFDFSSDLGNDSINGKYLQRLDLLKKFIGYFKDKVNSHKELRAAYDVKFQIEDEAGYFLKESASPGDCQNFLEAVTVNRTYVAQNQYLTKRELECLYWLAHGKTLDEIAKILLITHRTAKAHISNIKQKFPCANQFQLGMLYQQLGGGV